MILSIVRQILGTEKKGFLGLNKKWNNDLDNAMKEMKSYEAKLDNESIKLFEEFILRM